MSYKDANGHWQAGPPPGGVPEHLLHLEHRTPAIRRSRYLGVAVPDTGLSSEPTMTLAEAQERRRRRHAAQEAEEAAWVTEAQAVALGLDAGELYRDPELLGSCETRHGELMFSATLVTARTQKSDGEAEVLLAEMRAQGVDPLGGDAA